MKKRILAMLLSVSLLLSLPGIALAEDIQNTSSSGDLSAYENVAPDEEKNENSGKTNENENENGDNGNAVIPDDNTAQPGGSSGENGGNTNSAPAEGGEGTDPDENTGNENNGSATGDTEKPDDGNTDPKPVDPPASAPAAKPGEENGSASDSGETVTPDEPEAPVESPETPETPVPSVTPAEPQPGAPAACEECGALDGHGETCSQYIAPVTACPGCGLTDGHAEDCPSCIAPAAGIYDTLLAAGSVEELYDLLFADLNGEGESLALTAEQKAAIAARAAALNETEASEQYEELREILELMGAEMVHPLDLLEVGDTIWIKSGSKTYKQADASSDSRDVLFNYKTKVQNIVQNGNTTWYEFEPTGLLYLFKEYKFVKAEDTSVDEESAFPDCDCGDATPDESGHVATCARRAAIDALLNSTSAEDLWAAWDDYDTALQEEILSIAKVDKKDTYNFLFQKLHPATDTTGFDISVSGLPEGVTVSLSAHLLEREDYSWRLSTALTDENGHQHKLLFAVDITLLSESGEAYQPNEGEKVSVTLDVNSLTGGMHETNVIGILHEHDGELTDLGEYEVNTDGTVTFQTDGFSNFYGYTVDFVYGDTWYSITGGSGIYLSELFDAMGIDRDVEDVKSVVFSDPTLLTADKNGVVQIDHRTIGYTWYLQSLKAFDTEEKLTVTFENDDVETIDVYDKHVGHLSGTIDMYEGDTIGSVGVNVNGTCTLILHGDITVTGTIDVAINGTLNILTNQDEPVTIHRGEDFTGKMFTVKGKLDIRPYSTSGAGQENDDKGQVIIDGGAVWSKTYVEGSDTRYLINVTSGQNVNEPAIYVYSDWNGKLYLHRVTFQNLYSTTSSAAVRVWSDVVSNVTKGNIATFYARDCTFQNNAAHTSRSIVLLGNCNSGLTNCTFEDNAVDGTYGGIIVGNGSRHVTLTLDSCTFEDNYSSGWGSFLWAADVTSADGAHSKATVKNCRFENNIARWLGGAISNEAEMEITGTIITGNKAQAGGGIAAFPYTLADQSGGSTQQKRSCGLTLGEGNVISNNVAYAETEFEPFSETGEGADQDTELVDKEFRAVFQPGGGGLWVFINKSDWAGGLELKKGTFSNNTTKAGGGGVCIHAEKAQSMSLVIGDTNGGPDITKNTAKHGGGVAVYNCEMEVHGGNLKNNTAKLGGGLYVDETAGVTGKSALTVDGGIIMNNSATGSFSGETAQTAEEGVGGGIYIKKGSFTMSGESSGIGLHSNTATVAAADAFAMGGSNTTLSLPRVAGMNITGWTGEGNIQTTGWYADYMESGDSRYPENVIGTENPGRYNYYDSDNVLMDDVLNPESGGNPNASLYYCLTIGTPPLSHGQLVIKKTLEEPAQEDQSFIFRIDHVNDDGTSASYLTVTLFIPKGEKTAQVTIADVPSGKYTVSELTDWSWRYTHQSTTYTYHNYDREGSGNAIEIDTARPAWVVTITNWRTEDKWLSGDCYCENWWDKETVVPNKKPDEPEGSPEVTPSEPEPSGPVPSAPPAADA